MNYTAYNTEDFVTDEFFIQWVKNPGEESNAFWSAWLSQHPHKEAVVKEARQIVLMLNFKDTRPPEGKFLEVWERIAAADDRPVLDVYQGGEAAQRKGTNRGMWYKVAAAFVVATAAIAYVVINRPGPVVIHTAFGESRSLFLPDSTKVTLNANSTLRYAAGFSERNREVWLDGEAFFAVVHKKSNQNFRVHTSELKVVVLGTRFNVNTRRGTSKVVLEEGRVKLDIPDGNTTAELYMQPGELVEVSKETGHVQKKKVEADDYSSWRQNKLVLVSTSLEEIAALLEDNYGYQVQFSNDTLKRLLFTGSASVDNPGELVEKLNKVFSINIQVTGKDMIIQ